MESSALSEMSRTAEIVNPAPVPEDMPFVKSSALFKYVLKMKKKINDESYDYIEKCLQSMMDPENNMSNCVMYTDVENETMDQPLWYFGLNKETLEPQPIDIEKHPDYKAYSMIVISGGQNICIPGNWRDTIICPFVDRKAIFGNIKKARGYNPVFANAKALEANSNGRLTLFYTREIPMIFNMTGWNLKHGSYTDEAGHVHITLTGAQGMVVKFRELITDADKYAEYVYTGGDYLEHSERYCLPENIPDNSDFAKYKNLPGVVMRKDSKGHIFPSVEIPCISGSDDQLYKDESKDMTEYCILLKV